MGKKEKKKGGFGTFLGGTFFGILLGLGTVVGLGVYAYNNVSVSWVNKTFKTNISIGKKNNDKTLSELVTTLTGVVTDMDNYTLNDLKDDFGVNIKDKFKGIDISDLKDVPIKELPQELQNKLNKISIAELETELLNFSGDIEQIINSSYTYYFNHADDKLYANLEGATYSNPITNNDFEYTYNKTEQKISVNGYEFDIVGGKVEIGLKYLPIATAFANFNDLKVADVLGYSYDTATSKYYIDANSNSQLNEGEEVSTILNTLAGTQIGKMSEKIESLTLADMFSEGEMEGALSLIDNPEKVVLVGEPDTDNGEMSIADALSKAIQTKTLGELATAEVFTNDKFDDVKDKWIDKDTSEGVKFVQVKNLTLTELMTISLDALDKGGLLEDSNPSAT